MNYPYIEGISDIQETEGVFQSRTTAIASQSNNNFSINQHLLSPAEQLLIHHDDNHDFGSFNDNQHQNTKFDVCKQYIQRTLYSMGLQIDELDEYSHKKTLSCLLSILQQLNDYQRDKDRLKCQINEQKFQKNKYASLLEQAQKAEKQKNKKLGMMENNFEELKNKLKKIEKQSKKERDEDRKLIAMLKSKNQQISHQVKKKQNQTNRVREQMRKNVNNDKQAAKSSVVNFQIYDGFKKKASQYNQQEGRVNLLAQRFQNQRKTLVRENLLLKQKLYDIRQQIVKFAEWVDQNIFKQKNDYSKKFIVNHNLLFRKQSIVDEFNEILDDAKTGIKEIINMQLQKTYRDIQIQSNNKELGIRSSTQYSQRQMKSQKNILKQSLRIKQNKVRSPRKTEPLHRFDNDSQIASYKKIMKKKVPVAEQITSKKLKQKDCRYEPRKFGVQEGDEQQSQISMISHISMEQMVNKKDKQFEKWDILFNDQDDL